MAGVTARQAPEISWICFRTAYGYRLSIVKPGGVGLVHVPVATDGI